MQSATSPEAAEQASAPVEREEEALIEQSVTALGVNPLDLPPDQFQESLERRKTNRKSLIDWVREALVEGVDFGRIHFVKKSTCSLGKNCTIDGHFAKPSLFKPGAEKILGMLGITVNWPTLNQYEQVALDGKKIESIVLRCEAITASGEVAAEGIGARSVDQDGGDLNKALKMAKKSGMIDMTLTLGGLSEIFTQDIEDMVTCRREPQAQYPDLPTVPTEKAPRSFDRDAKLGFGKHTDLTYRQVDKGYLTYIARGDGDHAIFADLELDARKGIQPVPELKLFLDSMKPKAVTSLLFDRYGVDGIGEMEVEAQNDLLLWLQAERPVRELWNKIGAPANGEILGANFPGKPYRMLDAKEMESLGKLLTDFIKDPKEMRF